MTDTYETWMKNVDVHLVKMCGMAHDDLNDAMWYDYFESELSPLEAIETALDDAWWDIPEMGAVYDTYVQRIGVTT